ncbi:MAG: helix-turn-helix domain-containing protein [Oscillospiraceae bacterium]|nr:helix-turn-helix domain-containing protein [Oscillospiraceae bacterium]
MPDELLTVAQVADYLKLSTKTVYRLIQKGQLFASRIGNNSLRIKMSDVENYLHSRRLGSISSDMKG